jgi:small conductance mechanosensitive channel
LVLLLSIVLCSMAKAEATAVQATREMSQAEITDLVRLLEDEEARTRFLQRLKALAQLQAETAPAKPRIAEGLVSRAMLGFHTAIQHTLTTSQAVFDWLRQAPQHARALRTALTDPATYRVLRHNLRYLTFSLLPAALVLLMLRWFMRPLTRLTLPARLWTFLRHLWQAVLQVAATVLPTVGALLTVVILLSVLAAPPLMRETAGFLLGALLVYQLLARCVWAALSPEHTTPRLLPLADEMAHYLWIWARRFLRYGMLYTLVMFGLSLLSADPRAYQGVRGVLLCVFPILVTMFVAQIARQRLRPVAVKAPEGGDTVVQMVRRFLRTLWPLLVVLYVWALTIVILSHAVGGVRYLVWASVKTVLVTLGLFLVLRAFNRVLAFLFRISDQVRQRYPLLEAKANRYLKLLGEGCNGGLVLLAVGIVLDIWGVPTSWLVTAPTGRQILTRLFVIALAVGVTGLALGLSKAMADFLLQTKIDAEGMVHEPSPKRKTLVPLGHAVVKVGLIFLATLVLLEQLGVHTGPILAGVGILGLAVGFGAQSLVKDVINGLFILFEDSIAVGDVATLRGTGGVVEKITLRAVTLRDLAGNVHVIPHSSIDLVTNMTKEYSRYVLDVGVAYREDVDEVIGVLKEVDEAMRADPDYGTDMLEPIEILGLDRFDDSAVVIRARLKTKPIRQWRVGREFNRRMKHLFDARGIEIPFPHHTLYWGMPKEGAQEAVHVTVDTSPTVQRQDGAA